MGSGVGAGFWSGHGGVIGRVLVSKTHLVTRIAMLACICATAAAYAPATAAARPALHSARPASLLRASSPSMNVDLAKTYKRAEFWEEGEATALLHGIAEISAPTDLETAAGKRISKICGYLPLYLAMVCA